MLVALAAGATTAQLAWHVKAAGVARQSCVGRYSGEAVAVGPADADAGMYAGRGAGNSACSWRRSLEARQMLRTVTTMKAVSNKIMAALMVTIK